MTATLELISHSHSLLQTVLEVGTDVQRLCRRHYKGAHESGPEFNTRDLYLPWLFALPRPNVTTIWVHESLRLPGLPPVTPCKAGFSKGEEPLF